MHLGLRLKTILSFAFLLNSVPCFMGDAVSVLTMIKVMNCLAASYKIDLTERLLTIIIIYPTPGGREIIKRR